MVDEPRFCEAFRCLRPTEDVRPDTEMLVHPIDRSPGPLDPEFDSPEVREQVLRIHKACFNAVEYVPAGSNPA